MFINKKYFYYYYEQELAVIVNAILKLQQSFHSYVMNMSKCSGSDVYLLI